MGAASHTAVVVVVVVVAVVAVVVIVVVVVVVVVNVVVVVVVVVIANCKTDIATFRFLVFIGCCLTQSRNYPANQTNVVALPDII